MISPWRVGNKKDTFDIPVHSAQRGISSDEAAEDFLIYENTQS